MHVEGQACNSVRSALLDGALQGEVTDLQESVGLDCGPRPWAVILDRSMACNSDGDISSSTMSQVLRVQCGTRSCSTTAYQLYIWT